MLKGHKFIDCFSFSNETEVELLLLKLNVETSIDIFVITENDHSLQGSYKGEHQLKELLKNSRFDKFRNKIKLLEVSIPNLKNDGKKDDWTVLNAQRKAQWNYVLENFSKEDFLMVSDVDESLDCEDLTELESVLTQENIVAPVCQLYAFDFDNMIDYGSWFFVPIFSVNTYYLYQIGLQWMRNDQKKIYFKPEKPIAYHYFNCLSKEGLYKKYSTYGHVGMTNKMIDSMLRYNYVYSYLNKGYNEETKVKIGKIELSRDNSPQYVLDNKLKTNNVNSNYLKERFMIKEEIQKKIDDLQPFFYYWNFEGVETHQNHALDPLMLWNDLPQVYDVEKVTSKTILDCGANCGWFTKKFEEQNNAVTAVEFGELYFKQLLFVKEFYDLKFDVFNTNIEDYETTATYDLILFLGILYHVENPIRALKNVFRMAKKDVIIETDTSAKAGSVLEYENYDGDYRNRFLLSSQALEKMISYCGGKIIKTYNRLNCARKILYCEKIK